MSEHQVFINFVQQDQPIAARIQEELQAEGIASFMLPEVTNLDEHYKVLQRLESVIAAGGAVVLVVSAEALKSGWLVANAQYSCELAGRRTVLVICLIGDVPSQNTLALYYAQSVVMHAGSQPERSVSRLVNQVKRVLRRTDAPPALRPRRMPQRIVKRLLVGAAILGALLGIGNYFMPLITQARQDAPQIIATPVITTPVITTPVITTPVIFEEPFKGESLEKGIISDRSFVPQVITAGDPQAEAPFHFEPDHIQIRLLFNDPVYENVNVLEDGESYEPITTQDQLIILQTSGLLQAAVAPQDADFLENPGKSFGQSFNHLFRSGSFEYLGIRFRLDDYKGWSDANREISAGFGLFSTHNDTGLVYFNLQSQSMFAVVNDPHADHFLGADWHVLEFMPDPSSRRLDIYLDGVLFGKTDEMPSGDEWMQLNFSMQVPATSDWLNFYIDEVIFGGDQPLFAATQPQDAQFLFTPQEVLFQSTFDGPMPDEVIVETGLAFPISNGVFRFDIPSTEANSTFIRISTQPLNRMNYYAMRYRITDKQSDFWSTWGNVSMYLDSPALEHQGMYIGVFASRYGATYYAGFANSARGSSENFQMGDWHTMEMLIKPVSEQEGSYLLQYWHDGCFVGEYEIEPIEYFLEDADPLWIMFEAYAGDDSRQAFTGEFDEIIMGSIDLTGQQ